MTEMPKDVRVAIERLMIDYCYAVDGLKDTQPIVDLFTEDAVADFSALGLPLMKDRSEIKAFFDGVFSEMTHHFHFISNFRPAGWDGTNGSMDAYVIGMGRAKDGNGVTMQVKYQMECAKRGNVWKCHRYMITPMMPLSESLNEIHSED